MRGFIEKGTTTTPFDMVMLNDLDRYRLVIDVLDRVPGLAATHAEFRQELEDLRIRARAYTREHGEDAPEVAGWRWPAADADQRTYGPVARLPRADPGATYPRRGTSPCRSCSSASTKNTPARSPSTG